MMGTFLESVKGKAVRGFKAIKFHGKLLIKELRLADFKFRICWFLFQILVQTLNVCTHAEAFSTRLIPRGCLLLLLFLLPRRFSTAAAID